MTEAIFGLIGVVIGAAMTGAFEYWTQRRQRRAAKRQAIRLVSFELLNAWAMYSTFVKRFPETLEAPPRETNWYPTTAWQTYQATLALELDAKAWGMVAAGMNIAGFLGTTFQLETGAVQLAQSPNQASHLQNLADAYEALTGGPIPRMTGTTEPVE